MGHGGGHKGAKGSLCQAEDARLWPGNSGTLQQTLPDVILG